MTEESMNAAAFWLLLLPMGAVIWGAALFCLSALVAGVLEGMRGKR